MKTTLCTKCNREIRNNNFTRHDNSCEGPIIKKVRGVDFDPNVGYKDGTRLAWNKGNRSKPDTRNPNYIGKLGGYRENAGISKKFKVFDSFGIQTTLQSTYEYAVFEILCELEIRWVRPKCLKYDGRNYFGDFYLIDFDIYLDPKNDYKAKCDAQKIYKVIEQNSVKLFVLHKQHITKQYIASIVK